MNRMKPSLARRYAKAILSISLEDKQLEKVQRELEEFDQLVKTNKELSGYIDDPTILPMDKREAIKGITEKMALSEVVRNFLGLLAEKGRIASFGEVLAEFRLLADAQAGKAIARVTSAIALSPELEKNIAAALSKLTGRSVVVSSKVDPLLIGGIVAEIGGVVYDGSLKTQLRTLKERARQTS